MIPPQAKQRIKIEAKAHFNKLAKRNRAYRMFSYIAGAEREWQRAQVLVDYVRNVMCSCKSYIRAGEGKWTDVCSRCKALQQWEKSE